MLTFLGLYVSCFSLELLILVCFFFLYIFDILAVIYHGEILLQPDLFGLLDAFLLKYPFFSLRLRNSWVKFHWIAFLNHLILSQFILFHEFLALVLCETWLLGNCGHVYKYFFLVEYSLSLVIYAFKMKFFSTSMIFIVPQI